jgi:hypothetical protein
LRAIRCDANPMALSGSLDEYISGRSVIPQTQAAQRGEATRRLGTAKVWCARRSPSRQQSRSPRRYDCGFDGRCDAFDIDTPCENLLADPPFALIEKILPHFLPLVRRKLILLARLNILGGQERRSPFDATPPARVWVSSRRASIPPGDLAHPRDRFCAMNPLPASAARCIAGSSGTGRTPDQPCWAGCDGPPARPLNRFRKCARPHARTADRVNENSRSSAVDRRQNHAARQSLG